MSQGDQDFWYEYFEANASSDKNLPSFKINGFIDPVQTSTVRKTIINLTKSLVFNQVIDCGCGDGSVATALKSISGASVLGVEVSPSMALIANQKGVNTINSSMWEAFDPKSSLYKILSLLNQSDSIILFCESLVCIESPNLLVSKMATEFNHIGHQIISSPNKKSILRKLLKTSLTSKLNYIDFDRLNHDMEQAGYAVADYFLIFSVPFIFSVAINLKGLQTIKSLKYLFELFANNIIYRYCKSI